jgi:hypothetical protein
MCASRLLTAILFALLIVNQPIKTGQPSSARAREVLAWGQNRLPNPPWNVTISEEGDAVIGDWISNDAVVHHRRLYNFASLPLDRVLRIVNDDWMAATLQHYSPWTLSKRCLVGNTLIVQASGWFDAAPYRLRYWVWSDAEAFKEVILTYPSAKASDLESMADQFMGKAARCSGDLF